MSIPGVYHIIQVLLYLWTDLSMKNTKHVHDIMNRRSSVAWLFHLLLDKS